MHVGWTRTFNRLRKYAVAVGCKLYANPSAKATLCYVTMYTGYSIRKERVRSRRSSSSSEMNGGFLAKVF